MQSADFRELDAFPGYLTGGNFLVDGDRAAFATCATPGENEQLWTDAEFLALAQQYRLLDEAARRGNPAGQAAPEDPRGVLADPGQPRRTGAPPHALRPTAQDRTHRHASPQRVRRGGLRELADPQSQDPRAAMRHPRRRGGDRDIPGRDAGLRDRRFPVGRLVLLRRAALPHAGDLRPAHPAPHASTASGVGTCRDGAAGHRVRRRPERGGPHRRRPHGLLARGGFGRLEFVATLGDGDPGCLTPG